MRLLGAFLVLGLTLPPLAAQTTSSSQSDTTSQTERQTDRNKDRRETYGTTAKSGRHTEEYGKAGTEATRKLSGFDRQFVTKAAQGGMFEVELGKIAEDKASDQSVKDFAKRMVDDHQKANDELKQIAQNKNFDWPAHLDQKHRSQLDRFKNMTGSEFDKAYMRDMVRDHNKALQEFKRAAEQAKDPDIKNFASQTVPTLEQHHEMAHSTASKIGVQTATKGTRGKRQKPTE